jgi:hypothetical protein
VVVCVAVYVLIAYFRDRANRRHLM